MVFGSHFIFDGVDSRNYDLILCSFNGAQDESLPMGLAIEAVSTELRDRTIDYGGKWADKITFDFSVTHGCGRMGEPFSRKEIREIVSWLTASKELKWLSVYDEEDVEYWYHCRFTDIELQKSGGSIIGLNLEVTCDSPFAYSELKEVKIADYITQDDNIIDINSILHIDTDTDIIPNIILYQNGFSHIPVSCKLYVRINNTYLSINNHQTKDGYYLIDPLNLYMTYSETNNLLNSNGNIIPSNIELQTIHSNQADSNLNYTLCNGTNTIKIHFKLNVNNTHFPSNAVLQVFFQYREKYKVGVF